MHFGKLSSPAVHLPLSADQWGVFQRLYLSLRTCGYLWKISVSFETFGLIVVGHFRSTIFTLA